MKKHAYLIIAHCHFDMLDRLIGVLDSEYADFYVHIDKRAKGFDEARFLQENRKSGVHVFRKYKITWGADTLVRCEQLLLKQAIKRGYDYYHLLSGVDIPLRTGEEIEAFFEKQTMSFLEVKQETDMSATLERVKYYYPFQRLIGRQNVGQGIFYSFLSQLSYEFIKLQKFLGVDRTKDAPFSYCRGGQWFSITHPLALYIVNQERLIRKRFYSSIAADEMFMQCIAFSSEHQEKIIRENLRLVDWKRTEHGGCSPHTFTIEDYAMIIGSERLFARKFDPNVDREIIELLYARLESAKAENDN